MARTIISAIALGTLAAALALPAGPADAKRGGRGGGAAMRSMPASNGRAVRSSASANINRGPTTLPNRRGPSNGSGNRANINTGDINIDRDVNIDVDHGWGYDWDDHWHPVAAAAVTAAVVGTYYRALPSGCIIVYRGALSYYRCGTTWYQPVYAGTSVQYVVVVAP